MLTQDTINTLNINGKNILRETQLHNISDSFVPTSNSNSNPSSEVDNLILNSNLDNENIIK